MRRWIWALVAFIAAPVTAAELWTAASEMSGARYAPTATALPNGKILVAGGFDGSLTLRSAQLFDPASGFTDTGSLSTGRNFATATLLDDTAGRVLIAGGFNAITGTLDIAEIYDPAAGSFTRVRQRMESPRELFTATRLPDGRVLLAGGFNTHTGKTLASAEIYDPTEKRFTATGMMTAAHGRFGHAAAWLPTVRKVLIVGGKERTRSGWFALKSAELYDPATGSFTAVSDMGSARDRPTVCWVPSAGKALVIGGQGVGPDGTAAADVLACEWFDPVTNAFRPGPSLQQGRMAHTLTPLPDGSLLLVGGWSVALNRTTEAVERFVPNPADPLGGAFVPAGSMRDSRHDHVAAALPDGRVLIAGGKKVDQNAGTTLWLRAAELSTQAQETVVPSEGR